MHKCLSIRIWCFMIIANGSCASSVFFCASITITITITIVITTCSLSSLPPFQFSSFHTSSDFTDSKSFLL